MKSALSITHLIRHFLLFAFTVLFLLTVVRAGLSLWQLAKVGDAPTLVSSFLTGVRFDLATIGYLLVVPVIVVTFFAMFNWSRGFARWFSLLWLMLGLLVVLMLELVTPYFIQATGVRPDIHVLSAIENPGAMLSELWSVFKVPALIGLLLVVLILFAFWARLETSRFLRYPVVKWSAFLFLIIGTALCALAIRSSIDLESPGLGPDAALVSTEGVVNEITLNSTYKLLTSMLGNNANIDSMLSLLPKAEGESQ